MPFEINPKINAEMSALHRRIDAYTAAHSADVRDLAEVVDICQARHGGLLDDPDDSRTHVFLEAIAMYRQKHRITPGALQAALADWRAVGMA